MRISLTLTDYSKNDHGIEVGYPNVKSVNVVADSTLTIKVVGKKSYNHKLNDIGDLRLTVHDE